MNQTFANKATKLCYEKFRRLPKTGKPQVNREWTLLAGILVTKDDSYEDVKVVSLATGSKCIGASKLSPNGDIIHDSHAEVLARRSFLKYLYHQVEFAVHNSSSEILQWNKEKLQCEVKPGVKFHLFTSHTPCGDASIFPKQDNPDERGHVVTSAKRKCEDSTFLPNKSRKHHENSPNESVCASNYTAEDNNQESQVQNVEETSKAKADIYRTGAKCVAGDIQDHHGEGIDYHVVGALRIKPGRGDRTLSMSCSDKIARWNICGLQGALLSHLIAKPIYLSSIIIGKCPYSEAALHRAIIERTEAVNNLPPSFSKANPILLQSELAFEYSRSILQEEVKGKIVPSSASIIWCDIPHMMIEVVVNGRRQGVTKRDLEKKDASVSICKRELFKSFMSIFSSLSSDKTPLCLRKPGMKLYSDYKMAAESYQMAWKALLSTFKGWSPKPSMTRDFTLCNDNSLP